MFPEGLFYKKTSEKVIALTIDDMPTPNEADDASSRMILDAIATHSQSLEREGDRLVRKCSICALNVYDFAGMSPDQILALVNQHEGKLCAQFFYARADGTMIVESCKQSPEGQRFIRGKLIVS